MKSKTKKGIPCKLYTVPYPTGKIEAYELSDAQIIGKNILISNLKEGFSTLDGLFYDEYPFKYTYEVEFHKKVQIKGNKEKYLNTKIIYTGTRGDRIFEQPCYTYLSNYQRIINSKNFKKLWVLQPKNIKWIISIIISLLGGGVLVKILFHK